MRLQCERCGAATGLASEAYECTFCPECRAALQAACPNCGDQLVARPKRINIACGCGQ